MTRKKVISEPIKEGSPKKRPTIKKDIKKEYSDGWDKIVGVDGKIVRYKMNDREKLIEMGNMKSKGLARLIYSAISGENTYFYYELLKQ